MKRSISSVATRVVAVFSTGWQLISANDVSAASMTTVTRVLVSLSRANGVTEPGATRSTSASSSALPNVGPWQVPAQRLQLLDSEHRLMLEVMPSSATRANN